MIRTEIEISPHFKLHEFVCHDCGRVKVEPLEKLAASLELLRHRLCELAETDVPLHIHSGYRCEAYNRTVGGSPDSQHTEGRAVDLRRVDQISLPEVLQAALSVPAFNAGGIGVYFDRFKRGRLHLDIRSERAARWAVLNGKSVRWDVAYAALTAGRSAL